MTKDEAQFEALKQWRALPPQSRRTVSDAQAFGETLAMQLTFPTLGNAKAMLVAWLVRDLDHLEVAMLAAKQNSKSSTGAMPASGTLPSSTKVRA